MSERNQWHISRSFAGSDKDSFPECICVVQPCGLVVADDGCPQHSPGACKTMRRGHAPEDCPDLKAEEPFRSHPGCWVGDHYEHVCQEPSGRACHDCGAPAGTSWGPYWCPDCDVVRLDH